MAIRIGPVQVGRETPAQMKQRLRAEREAELAIKPELGTQLSAPGTTFFGGLISQEEYNSDLQGDKGLRVWEKMFKSDPTARAVEKAVTLPIRGATYSILAPTDQAADVEIAEFVENNLYGMTITFAEWLRHALFALRYGHYAFEPVWEIRDGQVRLRKMSPIMPRTIYRWYFDEDGGVAGFQQRVWKVDPQTAGVGRVPAGQYKFIDLPIEKLLILSNEREAGNYMGESIGRPMYKPWYLKDGIERIMAIGVERREIGVEYAQMASDASKAQEDAVAEMLASLHAQEQGYAIFPPTVSDKGVFGQGQGRSNSMMFLEYLKREMAVSGLAEFIAMGSGQGGSWAMHRDKSSFFLLAQRAIVEYNTDMVERHIIRRMVDYNFGPQEEYPRFNVTKLESRNVAEFATAVMNLATAQVITPDMITEQAIRAELELPDKVEPRPEIEEVPEEVPDDDPERLARLRAMKKTRYYRGGPRGAAYARPFARDLRPEEGRVSLITIETVLDTAEEDIVKRIGEIQERQIDKLGEIVAGIITKGDIDRIDRVDIPFKNDATEVLTEIYQDLYAKGWALADAELGTTILHQLPSVGEFLKQRAKALTGVMNAKLKGAFSWEALSQARNGIYDKVRFKGLLKGLSDVELKKVASFSASEALNMGRVSRAEEEDDVIAIYSSILDSNTCPECKARDGQRFEVGSPEYEQNMPPLYSCYGGGRCRCIYVYVNETTLALLHHSFNGQTLPHGDWVKTPLPGETKEQFQKRRKMERKIERKERGGVKPPKAEKAPPPPPPRNLKPGEIPTDPDRKVGKLKGFIRDKGVTAQGAKRSIQDQLADELRNDPRWQRFKNEVLIPEYGHSSYGGDDQMTGMFVHQWAASSMDSHEHMVALQRRASKKFADGNWDPEDDNAPGSNQRKTVARKANQLADQYGDGYDAFLEAQYRLTQKRFADAGVTHVRLYRGMGTSALADKYKVGDYVDLEAQPMSSFSTSKAVARRFGNFVVETVVPVQRIVGSCRTGFGCLNEQEFVVSGGPNFRAKRTDPTNELIDDIKALKPSTKKYQKLKAKSDAKIASVKQNWESQTNFYNQQSPEYLTNFVKKYAEGILGYKPDHFPLNADVNLPPEAIALMTPAMKKKWENNTLENKIKAGEEAGYWVVLP